MDDGSLQNKGLHLNTYGFTHEDILKLKVTFPLGENMFVASCPSVLSGQSREKIR